jgi:hypothetical protein
MRAITCWRRPSPRLTAATIRCRRAAGAWIAWMGEHELDVEHLTDRGELREPDQ